MMPEISIFMAFAAGVVSFLSPCVLPVVPGYISFISGVSIQEMREGNGGAFFSNKERRTVILNALFFIFGFSAVFILLGATATWIGGFLSSRLSVFTKIAGLIVIFFGVIKLGLLRPLFFLKETRFMIKDKKFGFIGTSIIGAAFGFGWTPCIGPILAGILTYAGTLERVNQGILLLMVYCSGLGMPFLLTASGVNQFFKFFKWIKNYLGLLEKATGVILVILGVLIFADKLILLPAYLPFLNKFAL